MRRLIEEKLLKWMQDPKRKPLVVQGVRQCGKTYSIKKFGKENFNKLFYFNFEKNPTLARAFEYDYDCNRILKELCAVSGYPEVVPEKDLVFFDEVQECPRAVTSLKYFQEDEVRYNVISAGSLLGVAIRHQNASFPVGKVSFLKMYPMSFLEFLWANECDDMVNVIDTYALDRVISDSYVDRLIAMLRTYYIIGGMPEVVQKWITTHKYEDAAQVQDDILVSYGHDFGKHLSQNEALKVEWVWDSIPVQLAKDNQKFVFSHVRPGKRASQLEDALLWLNQAQMAHILNVVEKPQVPLSFCQDRSTFKVYLGDLGLLSRKVGITIQSIENSSPIFSSYKGALTENFVMNELMVMEQTPYYWRSGNTAEVDFLIQHSERIIPIEAKSEDNTQAKSYKEYCKRYHPDLGIKMSMKNVGLNQVESTTTYSIPLYLSWRLPAYLVTSQ